MNNQSSLFEIDDSTFRDLALNGSLEVKSIMFGEVRTFLVNVKSENNQLDFSVSVDFLQVDHDLDCEFIKRSVESYPPKVLKNRLLFCSRYLYDDGSVFPDYAAELLCCLIQSCRDWFSLLFYFNSSNIF